MIESSTMIPEPHAPRRAPGAAAAPRTLFDKLWDQHVVVPETTETPAVLAIDLHLVHEVTSAQAFTTLEERGLTVRHPGRTVATLDHSTPTTPRVAGRLPLAEIAGTPAALQIERLERNAATHGIALHGFDSDRRGIVHVIGPELGLTQPGKTIVCGDSHTSTHGAYGALAFGIGSSEVAQVFATQCLLQRKPKSLAIEVAGRLAPGVSAKDLALAILVRLGTGGGSGHVVEYRGPAIERLSMEERMTLCNLTIEGGARAGMIAPDETTFADLRGKPHAPQGAEWERAVERWRELSSDPGAPFDARLALDASALEPMITWGTTPAQAIPIRGLVPEPRDGKAERALRYMGLRAGEPLLDHHVDVVFLGSCTNARLSDLRVAAELLRGRRVADCVRVLVVPGSEQVKRRAEEEGLAEIFREAGAEWREPGCSMCIAMNDDRLPTGQFAVSTSNRNYEGRQGPGGRTFLASPLTAAACALTGVVTDPREIAA
jgi:3-isopropylmalate/(R)-2-methylmalate dehydratase large subunit